MPPPNITEVPQLDDEQHLEMTQDKHHVTTQGTADISTVSNLSDASPRPCCTKRPTGKQGNGTKIWLFQTGGGWSVMKLTLFLIIANLVCVRVCVCFFLYYIFRSKHSIELITNKYWFLWTIFTQYLSKNFICKIKTQIKDYLNLLGQVRCFVTWWVESSTIS